MPTADEILDELRASRRAIAQMFASGAQDATSAEAAKRHEEEATKHAESAASHRLAAKKAMDDADEEDASTHVIAAREAQMAAVGALEAARKCYETASAELAASDETASKLHASEATRLQAALEAAKGLQASDEAAATLHEENAAKAKRKKGMMPFMAAMMSAMMDDDKMDASSLQAMLEAMVYPSGPRMATKKSQSAQHDDTAEDTALFRRLMKQYKDGDELSASHGVSDIAVARKLRSIEAAMSEMGKLLTDLVHGMRDLATDKASGGRQLSTDVHRGNNGGPVRRTMSATGGDYRSKFDETEQGDGKPQTEKEIDAALDEQNLDPVQRIAAKLMLLQNSSAQH